MKINNIKKAARKLRCFLSAKAYRTATTKSGYVIITSLPPQVRKWINDSGFNKFHQKMGGPIYEHQLVKYAFNGYRAYINGFNCIKGQTEIHHLNSDRGDNRPSNLRYVTPEENKLLAQATCTDYLGRPTKANSVSFNDRGEEVSDPIHYFANLVKLTVEATLNIKVPILEALLQLPNTLYKKLSNWGNNIWTSYERTYSNSW